jgi:hypothetical protein
MRVASTNRSEYTKSQPTSTACCSNRAATCAPTKRISQGCRQNASSWNHTSPWWPDSSLKCPWRPLTKESNVVPRTCAHRSGLMPSQIRSRRSPGLARHPSFRRATQESWPNPCSTNLTGTLESNLYLTYFSSPPCPCGPFIGKRTRNLVSPGCDFNSIAP